MTPPENMRILPAIYRMALVCGECNKVILHVELKAYIPEALLGRRSIWIRFPPFAKDDPVPENSCVEVLVRRMVFDLGTGFMLVRLGNMLVCDEIDEENFAMLLSKLKELGWAPSVPSKTYIARWREHTGDFTGCILAGQFDEEDDA